MAKASSRPTTSIEPWSDDHMVKPAELIDVRLPANLTLVDRRTFNALLRNAWSRIDQNGAEHVIALTELKGLHTGSNLTFPRKNGHRVMRSVARPGRV